MVVQIVNAKRQKGEKTFPVWGVGLPDCLLDRVNDCFHSDNDLIDRIDKTYTLGQNIL